jgi:hypothetical protein
VGKADPDASPDEVDQWRALLQLVAAGTEEPDDCCFGLWEGWGFPQSARRWPVFSEFSRGGAPAFVWPADHAWCVAADIDPHWAEIGASAPLIERLSGDPRLDAVEADPTAEQPAYRSKRVGPGSQAAMASFPACRAKQETLVTVLRSGAGCG